MKKHENAKLGQELNIKILVTLIIILLVVVVSIIFFSKGMREVFVNIWAKLKVALGFINQTNLSPTN